MKFFFSLLLTFLSFFFAFGMSQQAMSMDFKTFSKKNSLVVVIVIDQFRADYLTRFSNSFLKAGTMKSPGGFRFLMEKGSYFPFAEYDVLQNMTCSGHAMIMTGTHPALNGITLNEWYDRSTGKIVYCAYDPIDGLSPRNLMATTVGDELKNAGINSKIISVALKDRASIMLGGHRADLAFWFDINKFRWTTSSYYLQDSSTTPLWMQKLNGDILKAVKGDKVKGLGLIFDSSYGVRASFTAALAAVREYKMGRNGTPDILTVSLSTHDIMGHKCGPNSPLMKNMTIEEDREISRFLQNLGHEIGGLQNIVIALTADHGIAPIAEELKKNKINAGTFENVQIKKAIEDHLNQKFGTPSKKEWISSITLFHIYLNPQAIEEKKADSAAVEEEVKIALEKMPEVLAAFTRHDYLNNHLPVGIIGEQIRHSYLPSQDGDVVIIARPFFMEMKPNENYGTTHMTGWAYDRTVPLVIMAPQVKPGVYTGGRVLDLAPTLSFLLGNIAPAATEGRVLTEILR